MKDVLSLFLITMLIILLYILWELHKAGKVAAWMSVWENQRKVRKCFRQEGIWITIHDFNQTISVSFHHKGEAYSKTIPWTKVYSLYLESPEGRGLRQKLIGMFK